MLFDFKPFPIVIVAIIFFFAGCAVKKPQPVNLRPEAVYEADIPERSMEVRAREDFTRHQEAAALGNAAATHRVGVCYLEGYGVDRNEERGFETLRLAAAMDYSESKYRLGLCYAEGIGTEKNDGEAMHWMAAAAEQRHPGAVQWLANRGLYTKDPNAKTAPPWRHHHAPPAHAPGYGPPYRYDSYATYQGETAAGTNVGVGVIVRDTYDPYAIKAKREHDKRRETRAKPEVERIKREKAEKEQKKKDEEEQKKREEIKAKKTS